MLSVLSTSPLCGQQNSKMIAVQELSDYARTHSQRNGLKPIHSMKDSDLPELVTASNRLARGTDAARRLDIRETPMILIL